MPSKPAFLPLDLLWKYREFKRDEMSTLRVPYYNKYDVNEVTEYVRENGLTPLELSIIGKKALLTDGNHRIVAAKKLGISSIPVNVTWYAGTGEETFFKQTLQHFRKIDYLLELELRMAFDPRC